MSAARALFFWSLLSASLRIDSFLWRVFVATSVDRVVCSVFVRKKNLFERTRARKTAHRFFVCRLIAGHLDARSFCSYRAACLSRFDAMFYGVCARAWRVVCDARARSRRCERRALAAGGHVC